MRLFICTAGTSIAGGRPFNDDPKEYRNEICKRLADLEQKCSDETEFLHQASAEANSLLSLQVCEEDRVVFLSTETHDGKICAEESGRLLNEKRRINFEVLQIEGLQVSDPTRFRRVGVQKLFEALGRQCGNLADSGRPEVILNVTGGFKSVVPYVTLYGLLQQLPVVYLSEHSKALLRLPPVPVNFDYERLGQAMDALELLRREDVIPKERFFSAIPGLDYHGRDWYECLLEEDDGYVTISAFGSLFLKLRAKEQAKVLIGPSASRQYDASSGIAKDQFTFMLERVADPLWRKGKVHSFGGTDLTVFKPGNTSERMAAVVRGSKIYVCELLRHDEYERVLSSKRADQYQLNEFQTWVKPSSVAAPPSSEEEAYRELWRRYEETSACWEKAEDQLEHAQDECNSLRSEVNALRLGTVAAEEQLASMRAAAARSDRQIAELTSRVESLGIELATDPLPWWKRLFQLK
jgi:putative CRISPR-associated protein (TIGR02619 family)